MRRKLINEGTEIHKSRNYVAHRDTTDRQTKQKTYPILLFIALSFALITNLNAWTDENIQTIKKELPALKTEHPPTIDGVLDDPCWQDAPQATGFIDERSGELTKSQSVGHLVYTDKAIYLGVYLYDEMPDKIVARQTKDQTRFQGEDWMSFSLDPFHTHQFSDRNFFMANALGTKFAHLATGRAEKSEWIGLWKAAQHRLLKTDGLWRWRSRGRCWIIPTRLNRCGWVSTLTEFQQRTGERYMVV